jgi:hypothetical protein
MEGKYSFHADAKTRFSHGDCLARSSMFSSNYDTFKRLKPFFGFRFFDSHMNADRVSRLKLGDVAA